MSKIFGIGLSRTGTMSLNKALGMLGFMSIHFPLSYAQIAYVDAAVDTPVTAGYKFLDLMWPGSKFILTVRNVESWVDSCRRCWELWGKRSEFVDKLHMIVYGRTDFDYMSFLETDLNHKLDVRKYFREREQDLLIMDICGGDGWDKLCPFLGKEIPDYPFPKEHTWKSMTKSRVIGRGTLPTYLYSRRRSSSL
jgi:hypothetical protein